MQYYKGNWATYKILKRFFKRKQGCKKRIAFVDDDNGSDLDSKDVISKDNDLIIQEESDNNGNSDGDEGEKSNREEEGDGDGGGEENGNGDGDDDGEKDIDSEDNNDTVDSWNGKGQGRESDW